MLKKLNNNFVMLFILSLFLLVDFSLAHCDSMEGPVVKAAKKALEAGNVNYVLIWIKPKYETEVKVLFEKVINVRKLNSQAKELADMYFYETVVRLHRMGEGEYYTGLKPVDYKPPEGIEAADIALNTGSIDKLLIHIDKKYHNELKKLYDYVISKKDFDVNDIKAGRKFVDSYVHFIHYVEELFDNNKHRIHVH